MEIETYKQILSDIFDALEFTDAEKETAYVDFQEELAGALFDKTRDALSEDQQTWLKEHGSSLAGDESELREIRETISSAYPDSALKTLSHPLFKEIVSEYIDYMSEGEDEELKDKLSAIRGRL